MWGCVCACVCTREGELTVLSSEPLCLLLQLDPLLIHLHDALEGRFFTGWHLAGQMVDVDVFWNGDLSVANS